MVFVDLETTGSVASVDRITEIGIVELDAQGRMSEWSSLVNPQVPIPRFIQGLTGITDDMVAHAPTFAELAEDVFRRLQGRLFVAHNARFDYGFLQQSLLREQMVFRATVLCTVKLSRRLYPAFKQHSLGALIERHRLQVPARHRALADAQVLAQFWQILKAEQPAEALREAVNELTGKSQWPAHLDLAMLEALPEQHGVYVLYGADGQALHVGKGRNVRQQVLAHFNADRKASPSRRHGHLVSQVVSHMASGELGASLLKARLVQQLMPRHHPGVREGRQEVPSTWLCMGGSSLQLADVRGMRWDGRTTAYGLFGTQRDAIKTLREIAQSSQLCLRTLGLEPGLPGQPCKAWVQGQCSGVCVGQESLVEHSERLRRVLADWMVPAWPHTGPVMMREGQHWHLFDDWRYLGTVQDQDQVQSLLSQPRPAFDRETYKLVAAALQQAGGALAPVPAPMLPTSG